MKVLIVDDEPLARARLRALVEELGAEVVGEAGDGRGALRQCAERQPDIVLLDIRMPGMDGLEAARHLAALDNPTAVIFTTAYEDHALDAFEAQALDYLVKPVRKERLAQALAKARKLSRVQLTALKSADEHAGHARSHISVQMRDAIQLIPVADILYFLAEQKYTVVRHAGGQALIEDSLKTLEAEFGGRFVRVHRNALVASEALKGMEKDGAGHYRVRLRGVEECLEVSRRHIALLRKKLKQLAC